MLRNKRKGKYSIILFILILILSSVGFTRPLFSSPSSINSEYTDPYIDMINVIHTSSYPPPQESPDNYAAALQKAIYFYQQQRSGYLPENNTVMWRGDSFLNDGADVELNLTGGYFNDGGYLKLGFPMASTIATLAWSVYEIQTIFENIGQLDEILDAIKWGTDYLIRCHPTPDEFYFQIGDNSALNEWRGPVETAHMFFDRPSYKVNETQGGSAVTAATAAALAISSIVFNETDQDYASTLLTHAEQLDNLAWKMLSDDYYNANSPADYQSFNGFYDELSTSGILLYMKTDNITYLEKAENATRNWPKDGSYFEYRETHSWDDMHYMAQIFLSRETSNQTYVESIERNLDYWSRALGTDNITYTLGGLAYCNPSWAGEGALRFAANSAFIASVWSDDLNCTPVNASIYRSFAESQINYTLGDNPYNRSYLLGFGNSSWQNISHRTAHGSWTGSVDNPTENRHILYGALLSGPRSGNDFWNNQRSITEETGVACDYNAGYIGALAKMVDLYGGTPHIDFPNASWFRPKNITGLEYYGYALTNNNIISTDISVDLTNHGTWPAKVANMLSYRYYLNLTEVFEAGYSIENITININPEGPISVTVSNLIHIANNTYYVVVDYTGVEIYPGRDDTNAKESTLTFSLPSGALDSAWDPTNDWSFQGLNSTRHASEYIPIFDDNVLIYGKCPGNDTIPPMAATGLNASVIDSSRIELNWDDNIDSDLYAYYIYRGNYSGFEPNSLNKIGESTINQYLSTMLYDNTTYYYIVKPVDKSLNLGAPSNEVNATTLIDFSAPDSPTGLSPPIINSTEVFLDWNDNLEPDVAKYFIYRSIIESFITNELTFLAETTISEYTDINISVGTTYYYLIIAVDINGNPSAPSFKISATVPSINKIPPGLITGIALFIAIMMSLLGSIYILTKKSRKSTVLVKDSHEKSRDHTIFVKSEVDVLDNSRLIHIFEEEELLQRLDQFKNITITILEEDFLENIEKLDWDNEFERKTFIKEMLILTPNERKKIIKEMLNDFYNQSPK